MRSAMVLVAAAAMALLCTPSVSATLADGSPARLRRHAAAQRRAALGCGDEGQALSQIYTALGGGTWWQRGGWLTGDHCAGWYGVTCQLGHVTELGLNSNNLQGALPSAIGCLPGLSRLRLNNNPGLVGPLPAAVGELAHLVEFDVTGNENLSGALPSTIGQLTSLVSLQLSGVPKLTGPIPASLGDLTALQELVIQDTGLQGSIPDSIGHLVKLESLSITHNPQLTGPLPETLADLKEISTLRIRDNARLGGTIPPRIAYLPTVFFLELANNALSGSVPTDFCLAYYADLDLSGNPDLTPVDCPPDLVTGQEVDGDAGKELPKDDGAYY